MSIRNKLFLSFFALIALNLFVFKFVFEDIIVVQLKTDRHNQYRYEKETAEKVRVNQLLSASNFKDPTDRSELEKQLPEDLVYKMLVKDANGNTIFIKTSQAYNLKNPPRKIKKENTDLKVVAEYHFQHEPPKKGETIIYFYTDDSDIMATKGVSMMLWYIYGSIALVGLVLLGFFVRWIHRPVNELSRVTQEIREGKRLVSFTYHSEDEFGRLFRYFSDMVDQLRFSEERQSELISAIAHDFRTPLTTIKGYASYIASGRVTDLERIKKQMKKIEQKTDDLDKLLDELQDFTQQSTELKLNLSRIHVKSFAKGIIEDYLVKIKESGLTLQWKLRISNDLYIEADETKLRRVLENLLNNAIYYNKPNGSILLTCDQREGHVLFSVIDKGEGISQEDLTKIFTKFYRAEKSRNRNNGGTGLGLTICQSIVQRHGGSISVSSELGRGSSFSFTIPFFQS
ncbi:MULTISPECIES: sensor histidine kinase [Brevibacillus]|jgi:signal transduction histidine kinase|uniref:histidine kinase n=1 Tax=Brevibacillus borstelensis AK1 TaxID=1300222 RepID=M8DAP7_9BACL|nr:HAMP domain-containing sensor histidine kinase [Brevibacillus borstelensis]EMT50453.1 two-component sensor histidine kinase [Brevibacillus borstelensis AK1]KKX53397.1 histidine kinase [Brevibacillus borstelensis cifa_chp40]MBE5396564.1 HAMP domain-containing histidine kinase [Brevibacillus borstelensis]MCC0566817.1 HAMP domain-containing histidine kinase [Brevibacillus borstelensis]MCM3471673.1 HAMP domain-containing histidine kinase [Brevibacillus borstelensis]